MNTTTSADIFFIVSSFGFITVWVLMVVLLFYLIRAMYVFLRIISKIERDLDKIGDIGKELLLEIKDSAIFNFIFGRRAKGRKEIKK